MFNDDEDWSPFSVRQKPIERQAQGRPEDAVEVRPIIVMSKIDHARPQVVSREKEAEAPAETDPKATPSSATNNAEDLGSDSSPTGSTQTLIQMPIHPSSLLPDEDNPVSAEKDQTPAVLTFTPMNLG